MRKCPQCGRQKLRRLIGTGVGVIFKGSGFYQTDYRSEGYKCSQKKETQPPTSAAKDTKSEDKKNTEKTETKPDTKDKKK